MPDEYQDLFKYLALIFLSISVLIVVYFVARIVAGLDKAFPLGESLVKLEWPSPKTSIIYAKPITYLVFFTMLAWLFGLEALRSKFLSISDVWIRLLMIIAGFIAFASGYETFWNFAMWAAIISREPSRNPDTIPNTYPNPNYSVNFVFATKMFTLTFFAALYFLVFLLTIIWKRERSK